MVSDTDFVLAVSLISIIIWSKRATFSRVAPVISAFFPSIIFSKVIFPIPRVGLLITLARSPVLLGFMANLR